ncbi:MAG: FIST C-terminal domain-containing protein [Myxococcales bacterium]|nr:FIST C-terminal domain-containing protein [Myxococcales bacterium]
MADLNVEFGHSKLPNAKAAAAELIAAIRQPNANLTVFFCSPQYDLATLGACLDAGLSGPVIGCTTAGEISSIGGYGSGGITGFSVRSDGLAAHVQLMSSLHRLTADSAREVVDALHDKRRIVDASCFALLLVDGMSMLEELTTAFVHAHLRTPLIGGSAGDDLSFNTTHIYADGAFHTDAAVLCLVETTLPFMAFKSQHIVPSGERLVITSADPSTRRVMEIDGEIAAVAYAELLGVRVEDLGPDVFSRHPVMLRLGGEFFVRAIQRVEDDGSLVFYCAIDNGLVMTLGKGGDLLSGLRAQLEAIQRDIGEPALILGCDCILRRLEMEQRNIVGEVEKLLADLPFVGFSSYGEQIGGVHVNQTLTGVAIGMGSA